MNTVEDFKNVPVGTTATHPLGNWVMKTDTGLYMDGEQVEGLGYTLKPPAPTTARGALDLAWILAYPVKEGQVIPEGTRYLIFSDSGVREYTAPHNVKIDPSHVKTIRTFDPLPDTEPYWLDAPAVIAVCNDTMNRAVFVREGDNSWRSEFYGAGTADLRDVVPLYPKETDQ